MFVALGLSVGWLHGGCQYVGLHGGCQYDVCSCGVVMLLRG